MESIPVVQEKLCLVSAAVGGGGRSGSWMKLDQIQFTARATGLKSIMSRLPHLDTHYYTARGTNPLFTIP
jgi:hypothetical protein